jgi:hypothetical protein
LFISRDAPRAVTSEIRLLESKRTKIDLKMANITGSGVGST